MKVETTAINMKIVHQDSAGRTPVFILLFSLKEFNCNWADFNVKYRAEYLYKGCVEVMKLKCIPLIIFVLILQSFFIICQFIWHIWLDPMQES